MNSYVALLRAINVGGTGKLPMSELVAICQRLGFGKVKTYIASGNVVFQSTKGEAEVKSALEAALCDYAGKQVPVVVRSAAEMGALLNPFADRPANYTLVYFFDQKAWGKTIEGVKGRVDEEIHLGEREIYVFYPQGMGRSRLVIPEAKSGTTRNMNTVVKLTEMATAL